MSLLHIRATFICDSCGSPFIIMLDPAYVLPGGWTIMDNAEADMKGGGTQAGEVTGMSDEGDHLCHECCAVYDGYEETAL